jgi:hypothetical protein
MKKILFIAFLFVIFIGCEKWTDDKDNQYLGNFAFNDTIELNYGRCLSDFERQIEICFDSVLTDSRCPEDVVCIWAGEAVARFKFKLQNNSPVLMDLHVGTVDTVINNYKFSFIDLLPHPNTENQTKSEDYKAKIVIKQK